MTTGGTAKRLGLAALSARSMLTRMPAPLPPLAVICSDKTGTLTTNQMSAVQLAAYGGSLSELTEWEVTG